MPTAQPGAPDAALRLQDGGPDAGDTGLLHAQVDTHAFAGSVAAVQREQQRIGHVVAGGVIHVVVAISLGRAALDAGQVGHAAHRVDRPRARPGSAPGPAVAESRAAQRNDARIDLRQAFVVEAVTAHRAGPEVVGHDVAVLDELEEHLFPGRRRHFQTQTLLVTRAEVRQIRAFVPPLRSRLPVDERPGLAVLEVLHAFDADDFRA